jgi:hypothetical protein
MGNCISACWRQYAPASVIVDERLNVVHLSATAGRFLHLGEGEPNHSLLGLAREDLRRALRTALHQAFRDRVIRHPPNLHGGGRARVFRSPCTFARPRRTAPRHVGSH